MNKNDYILPDHRLEGQRRQPPVRARFVLAEEEKQLGRGKTYWLRTYGCAANVRDGETLAGLLEAMGFQPAAVKEEADVLLFNTCAVRRSSEDHVFGELGTLKAFHQEHPEKVIGLCGCMAQEESVVKRILETYPQVDLIFGTRNLDRLPALLAKAMQGKRTVEVPSTPGGIMEDMPVRRHGRAKAFVNIAYGCDKFCTYCIVPYTRGRERSRLETDILREIEAFQAQGGKEVMLLGQNVNSYGRDLGYEDGFTHLLTAASETGIARIRFDSPHPRDFEKSTLEAMASCPGLMPSLHLPVQSGSDTVLARMNRGYTTARFRTILDTARALIPGCTFSTDLIVGFPGETDQEFQDTLKLVDACRFDQVYSFIYSPREGTPAAAMADDTPRAVKEARLQELNAHINHWAHENNQKYLGKKLEVLCEGPSKKNAEVFSGYSREFKLVNFTGTHLQEGDLVSVEITGAKSFSLDGRAVSD